MPRKNPNKSYYHYAIKEFNKEGELININFYMTQYDIMEKLGISHQTICNHLKQEGHRFRKYKNIKIEKVSVPVYKQVINDVFSDGLLDEYSADSSDSDHREIDYIEDLPNGKKHLIYEPK